MEPSVHRLPGIDASAAVAAGLIAGVVCLVLEMLLVPLFLGGSLWAPPRMISAIVMGEEILAGPLDYRAQILFFAILIHLGLSVFSAFVLGFIIRGRPVGQAMLIGGVFGLVVYGVNFYAMTELFPWFVEGRNWVTVLSHLVFGVVLAWIYVSRACHPVSEPRVD